jgi:outer membrane protein assembly factor BamB
MFRAFDELPRRSIDCQGAGVFTVRNGHHAEVTAIMRMHRSLFLVLAMMLGYAASGSTQSGSLDYPQWRGPNRDGSASALSMPRSWPDKLTLKWKVDVGEGYATPIVIGNRVFSHTRRGGNEVMTALDAGTGKTLWQTDYPAPYKMNPATRNHGEGPKSTPLYYDGKLFTLGISGIVSAFDASTGKLLWQKPAPPVDPLYGAAMSPVADRGTVIFHVGGHNQGALTAFDAATGAVKWSWSGDGPAYASPLVVELGGVRQVVTITQQKVVGVAADTGALLWERPFVSRPTNNSIMPILFGNTIIVSGYELGVTGFQVRRQNDQWVTETLWETKDVSMFMSNPVLIGDTLYGLSQRNSGQFFALDAKTGKTLWLGSPREATNTAVVKAGDFLLLLNDDAELIVARSSRSQLEVIQRYTVGESATWAQPAVSGNRVFIKDVSSLGLWTLE